MFFHLPVQPGCAKHLLCAFALLSVMQTLLRLRLYVEDKDAIRLANAQL
jgi:hypothetical protein